MLFYMPVDKLLQMSPFWAVNTGDIGGSLGLYLGASILTVVELLDILFGIVSAVIISKDQTFVYTMQ